jgi:dihydrofolate reductase
MRVTLFMSISMNGMIGRLDGRGDFFSDICWHGFVEVVCESGALIFGRSTYEMARNWSSFRRDLVGSAVRGVVLTRSLDGVMEESWEAAASPPSALERLSAHGVEAAVVAGGTAANAAFLREGLVDEVTLFVESVIIPAGLPLVPPGLADVRCRLVGARTLTDSVARLDFSVTK